MKVILHIGCEKTGTTTLQRFMHVNRAALRRQGICYAQSPGETNHTKLAVAAMSESKLKTFLPLLYDVRTPHRQAFFRSSLVTMLTDEAKGSDTLILSSEHCSSSLTDEGEIVRLRDILRKIAPEIHVVVYLRRQDDFLASNYSTQIRLGALHKLQFPTAKGVVERYDYEPLLARWDGAFDKVSVRLYDRRRLVDGDIIRDFLDACGVPWQPEFEVPPNENVALGRDQIEFLRRLNKFLPLVRDGSILNVRGNIGGLIDRIPQSGGKVALSPEASRRFMALFREANARVADRYLGGQQASGDPLFGEAATSEAGSVAHQLSDETAVEIFMQLLEAARQGSRETGQTDIFELFARLWMSRERIEPEPSERSPLSRRARSLLRNTAALLAARTQRGR